MRRYALLLVLGFAALVLPGCGEKGEVTAKDNKKPAAPPRAAEKANLGGGSLLTAYAPATDFAGASPEDAVSGASAMFDGTRMRDAVSSGGFVPAGGLGQARGKRIQYTAGESRRISDLNGTEPPLPDDYDYSRGGATPGSAREAGQTLLGFAKFQLEQKFPTVAPIMSRLGWRAAPRTGANQAHDPYRVTVHHTQGAQPMNEAQTAAAVKGTQHYHMVGRAREGKEAFHDIGYHFLIAGDGRVVEGRRAEYLGAHAGGANAGNIGVAMMGDFNKVKPTNAQIESLTRLVTFLSVKYKKDPNSKGFLEAHNHYTNTDCPGKHMMAILDALRRKIDKENEIIIGGGSVGTVYADFQPLAVVSPKSA